MEFAKERGRLILDNRSCRKIKRYMAEILMGLENKRTSPINRTRNKLEYLVFLFYLMRDRDGTDLKVSSSRKSFYLLLLFVPFVL